MTTAPTTAPLVEAVDTARPASLWRDTLGSILRQRSAVVGLAILGILVFVGVFAPLIATHDPDQVLLGVEDGVKKRAAPCIHVLGCPADQPQHLFGTDGNFRDVFSRVVYGTRTLIGAIAGYAAGSADNVLMRAMDVVLAFPSLLLAIAIVISLGTSYINALFAIAIVSIPVYARLVRSSVISAKENDYVTASRALGESSYGILTRRIMPNAITPIIVQGTLGIGTAVLEIAALAFIGAAPIGAPEWGSMIALERNQLFTAPHIILAPGIAITFTVLAFNLLGDGLRDALDPRLNR
jgi:ABC-type dipeptide/oligopeptide/nickel transport system permease subunit